jgi:hypothetical protein
MSITTLRRSVPTICSWCIRLDGGGVFKYKLSIFLNSERINTKWVVDCCVCVHSAHGEQQEIPRQLHNAYQYNGADYDKEGPRGDIQLDEGEEEGKFCLLL